MSGKPKWGPSLDLRRTAESHSANLREALETDHEQKLDIDAALKHHSFMCIDLTATTLARSEKEILLQDVERTSWSALTLRGDDWKGIVYNPNHGLERQRSDKAHELAHELLQHKPDSLHEVAGGLILREYDEVKEKEAGYLGGVLLVSDFGIKWAVASGMTRSEMKDHYGVSPELIRYRLNALRMYWKVAA